AAGLIAWAVRGLNYNVEFTGGAAWTLRFEKAVTAGEVRSVLAQHGLAEGSIVQTSADGRWAFLRTAPVDQATQEAVLAALEERIGPVELDQFDSISPVIGQEIREKGLLAVVLATVAMIVYLTVRFEFWFAVAAILAMLN